MTGNNLVSGEANNNAKWLQDQKMSVGDGISNTPPVVFPRTVFRLPSQSVQTQASPYEPIQSLNGCVLPGKASPKGPDWPRPPVPPNKPQLDPKYQTAQNRTPTPTRRPPPIPLKPKLSQADAEYETPSVKPDVNITATDGPSGISNVEPLYIEVLPDENPMPPKDGPRPDTRPARPPVPPRPSALSTAKGTLPHSTSEKLTLPIYEDIDALLTDIQHQQDENSDDDDDDNGIIPPTPHQTQQHKLSDHCRFPPQCSVSGTKDRDSKELDELMDWWSSVEMWNDLSMTYQGKEDEANVFVMKAHRVRMGMRLFELLLLNYGKIIMNHITELHCTAEKLSKFGKKAKIASITGGATGAAGGVVVIAGLALAPLTFGASLLISAIGTGVIAAGGVTGASAAITNKVSHSQDKKRVEKILRYCKAKLMEIQDCLKFVSIGMDSLLEHDVSTLSRVEDEAAVVAGVAVEVSSSLVISGECSGVVECLDMVFSKEDVPKLKKGSDSKLASKIHTVAEKLKAALDDLIQIKNMMRLAEGTT